jgi:epoxide hydrolase 4
MRPDPAVLHANQVRKGHIAYHESYFGEGDERLHYVEAGEGPLIIFYHGFPSFWYCWFNQMEMLKSHYRVVAVDGLGSGLSAKPDSLAAYKVESLAAQLDAFARHLSGRKRFTLIGHDWGAALSFAYAQAYPKRLNAVIGMSAPPYNLFLDLVRSNAEQQARSHYMEVFRGLTLDAITEDGLPSQLWERAYDTLISTAMLSAKEGDLFRLALADPAAIHGGMNWYRANLGDFADSDLSHHWPAPQQKITTPSMLIWGDKDRAFVEEFLTQIDALAPGISVVRIPDVGHWTSMEKPEIANSAIVYFLRCYVRPVG